MLLVCWKANKLTDAASIQQKITTDTSKDLLFGPIDKLL